MKWIVVVWLFTWVLFRKQFWKNSKWTCFIRCFQFLSFLFCWQLLGWFRAERSSVSWTKVSRTLQSYPPSWLYVKYVWQKHAKRPSLTNNNNLHICRQGAEREPSTNSGKSAKEGSGEVTRTASTPEQQIWDVEDTMALVKPSGKHLRQSQCASLRKSNNSVTNHSSKLLTVSGTGEGHRYYARWKLDQARTRLFFNHNQQGTWGFCFLLKLVFCTARTWG